MWFVWRNCLLICLAFLGTDLSVQHYCSMVRMLMGQSKPWAGMALCSWRSYIEEPLIMRTLSLFNGWEACRTFASNNMSSFCGGLEERNCKCNHHIQELREGCGRWHQQTCHSWLLQVFRTSCLLITHLHILCTMASKQTKTEVITLLTVIWENVSTSAQTRLLIAVKWRVMGKEIPCVPRSSSWKSASGPSLIPFFVAHQSDLQ